MTWFWIVTGGAEFYVMGKKEDNFIYAQTIMRPIPVPDPDNPGRMAMAFMKLPDFTNAVVDLSNVAIYAEVTDKELIKNLDGVALGGMKI